MSCGVLSKRFWCLFFFFYFGSPGLAALTPVAGVEPSCCHLSCRRRSFFFSRRTFAANSELLERGGDIDDSGPRALGSSGRGSFGAWALAAEVYSNRLPRWQCWSRSRLAEACILALASAWVPLLIRAFQPSRSRPSLSIHSRINGLRPL